MKLEINLKRNREEVPKKSAKRIKLEQNTVKT